MSTLDGTWKSDPVHSALYFSVRHSVIATFRGVIDDFAATLTPDGDTFVLEGVAKIASITTKDDNLTGHLQSPDFFDLEREDVLAAAHDHVVGTAGDEEPALGIEVSDIAR